MAVRIDNLEPASPRGKARHETTELEDEDEEEEQEVEKIDPRSSRRRTADRVSTL